MTTEWHIGCRLSAKHLTALSAWPFSSRVCKTVVTCEILFWNNLEIILVFYFTCYHAWNWISAAEKVWNYFKIISATLNMLKNIHKLWWSSEIFLKEDSVQANSESVQCHQYQTWHSWQWCLRMPVGALILIPVVYLSPKMGSATSISYVTWKVSPFDAAFRLIMAVFHCACTVSTILLIPV